MGHACFSTDVMFCFSSDYQNSLAKMFKIPDFDKDVPQMDFTFSKTSTAPNGKTTNNKESRKHKPMVKKEKIGKTANNSIVKAKDKVVKAKDKVMKAGKHKAQKNVQIENQTYIQKTKVNKFKKSKQKLTVIESGNSIPRNTLEINKSANVASIKNKIKKPKSLHEAIESGGLVKNNKKKQKHKMEELDEKILDEGKKRLNNSFKQADKEIQLLFRSNKPLTKKERLKNMLMGQRSQIKVKSNLREQMLEQLRSAQFRYLNEKLYTSSGREAQELFLADPAAFRTYHAGYQQQLCKWPLKPLQLIAKRIKSFPKSFVVADMGCGEGELARLVPQTVHSFDLVAAAPHVTACDMARTPLAAATVDVAVYCLALMGTQITDYLLEANRILKVGGWLLIAEVESRFESAEQFAAGVARLGFAARALDRSRPYFHFLEFAKTRAARRGGLPQLTLKPCLYKRR